MVCEETFPLGKYGKGLKRSAAGSNRLWLDDTALIGPEARGWGQRTRSCLSRLCGTYPRARHVLPYMLSRVHCSMAISLTWHLSRGRSDMLHGNITELRPGQPDQGFSGFAYPLMMPTVPLVGGEPRCH